MIQSLTFSASPRSPAQETNQVQATEQLSSIDQQVMLDPINQNSDPYIDQLYESLKRLWEVKPNISVTEIVAQLSKFSSADNVQPYQSIRTHTVALSQMARMLKDEGGESTAIYDTLKKGIGFSVVSNGILDSFVAKMMERPEEIDPW